MRYVQRGFEILRASPSNETQRHNFRDCNVTSNVRTFKAAIEGALMYGMFQRENSVITGAYALYSRDITALLCTLRYSANIHCFADFTEANHFDIRPYLVCIIKQIGRVYELNVQLLPLPQFELTVQHFLCQNRDHHEICGHQNRVSKRWTTFDALFR